MDEPLSNLDAKLRAQMRVELAKLHKELKTTVIYVTHDQTEAMTLGTKIIVMKDGVVQQADTPEQIYRHPANKFVAGFIGAPSMNFMETMVTERNGAVYLEGDGGVTLRARGENEMVLRRTYLGKMVILGLRPEDLQDEITASAHRICYKENQLKAFGDDRCRSVSAYEYRKKSDYSKSAFRGAGYCKGKHYIVCRYGKSTDL